MARAPSEKLNRLTLSDDYFPFHLLKDRKTEMYIKFAKVMVICQGPYTKAREDSFIKVQEKYTSASRVLSDETYIKELRTFCDSNDTEEFYEYLKVEVKNALESGYNLIYIDTTMSNLRQNQYYCSVANKMQYVVLVMPPVVTEGGGECKWPKGSQAHSFQKLVRIEAPNMFQHLFCAFFLHDMDTADLRTECALYVNDLFENIPEFCSWFSKVGGDADKFPKYFGLIPDDVKKEDQIMREDVAFCPMKIFSSEFQMSEYFGKPVVKEHYGKMSKLFIIGFVVSPHMVAARVKLTHKQKDLWDMNDNVKEDAYVDVFPSELYKESKASLPPPVPDVTRICSKSNTTITRGDFIHEPSKLIPPFAKGRTCHIVLGTGTAPGASPADIDYGVAFALDRDVKASKGNVEIEIHDIGKSEVKKIGKYWFIYLKDTLIINGFFASCIKPRAFDTPVQAPKEMNLKR